MCMHRAASLLLCVWHLGRIYERKGRSVTTEINVNIQKVVSTNLYLIFLLF